MSRRGSCCGAWRGLAFLLLACGTAAFGAEVSLPDRTGAPGSSLVAPLAFAAQGANITGLQFDLQFDSTAMDVTVTAGDALRKATKNLYTVPLAQNKRRILLIGRNQTPLPEGTLLNVFLNVYPSAAAGTYSFTVSQAWATNPNGDTLPLAVETGRVTVQGTQDQAVRLQPDGVVNAASMLAGPVAPGEAITLLGSGIGPAYPATGPADRLETSIQGTQVLVGGVATPLLYVSPNQINAVAPADLSSPGMTAIVVQVDGSERANVPATVAAASPGLFTLDENGAGQAVAFNPDGALNSALNPAARGSDVLLLVNGAGIPDLAANPLSVRIGGEDAAVAEATPSPGLVPSLMLVRCRVPAGIPANAFAPVAVKAGAVSSQDGVTLAVR